MINLLGGISLIGILFLSIFGVIILGGIVLFFILVPIKNWFKALTNGAYISSFKLIGLKQRKVDLNSLVDCFITIKKSGLNISLKELEALMISGGNINNVVEALVTAENSNIDLSVDLAKSIDLAGFNAVEVVKNCITPKVFTTNDINAVAKDEIEITLKVKITAKPILYKFVGGTGEETIVAKISESVISTIASLNDYKEILQNPELVTRAVLSKFNDPLCAYEILSLEFIDVVVGRNVGQKIKLDEIELQQKMANVKAEQLKNDAFLKEQKMRLMEQEIKVEKLKAEAEVPKKLLKVFEDGNLSLMDYYKLQNLIADTNMRKAITKTSENDGDEE